MPIPLRTAPIVQKSAPQRHKSLIHGFRLNEPINPFDIENVRYAEAEYTHGDIDAREDINAIAVRKPVSNKEWFRVHPGQDYQMPAALFERETPESTKPEQWLVPRPCRRMFNPKALTPVIFRLAVTSLDVPFLWPVKRPRKGMRDSRLLRRAR